jgi:hypothetical protein
MESLQKQSIKPFRAGSLGPGIAGFFANRSDLLRSIRNAMMAGAAVVSIVLLVAWGSSGLWNNTLTGEEFANAMLVRDELFGDLIGNGDYSQLSTVVAPNAELMAPGGTLSGPDGMRMLVEEMQRVEKPSGLLLLDVTARQDLVLATWTIDQPQASELLGYGPTTEAGDYVSGQLLLTIVDHQIAGLTMTTWQD